MASSSRLSLAVCFALLLCLAAGSSSAHILQIGALQLRPCPKTPAYCGELARPWDPTGHAPGQVNIHFEYYRHSGKKPSLGLLVATEGGPGYPATQSRDEYLTLFAPLMREHDALLMDNRGTGGSAAVDCPALQTAVRWTVELTADCGISLNERASLFSTAYAADDLAAILEALKAGQIDLYGDSYGTYFAQVFALRHPATVRSIILDGAYPLNGPDYAWYPSYAPAMRDKFNTACRRYAPCDARAGDSISHIQPLLDSLRAHPFQAQGFDVDGRQIVFRADASKLAIVMYGSAPTLVTTRELDAAARAFLNGDQLPVLRLMAETTSAVDSRDPTADASKWSAGLAAAVMCTDPPQIFDMRLPPQARLLDRDRAVVNREQHFPQTYAPFTIEEYRGMPLDYSFIDQCVQWPSPPSRTPPFTVVPDDAQYPDIPALVISGELDNITTVADGAAVAAAFKHSRQVLIANSFHVNALAHARNPCGAQLVREFIETHQLKDAGCAATVPPLRLVDQFATHAEQLSPVIALAGNHAGAEQLKMAAAVLATAADVLARVTYTASHGVGLRGGTFFVRTNSVGTTVALQDIRWTEDVTVTGRLTTHSGIVEAHLDFQADAAQGHFDIDWPRAVASNAVVSINGRVNAARVVAIGELP